MTTDIADTADHGAARMTAAPAVEAVELVKHFGDTRAVDDVSFVVPAGSVLGLLGPNGAGKTTLVRMLTTLSVPTSGTGRVAGFDIIRQPNDVRRSMGLTGQAATVDEILTGRENLKLIGALYGLPKKYVVEATERLFARFDLTDAADRMAKTYSGGMRRRLDLAVSLLAAPPILFLDEPTTGLDPHSRSGLWEVLRELVRRGHHAGADHAVPGGGRPPGRRDRRRRQGQGHRRRHAHPAQGPGGQGQRRGHADPRRRPRRRRPT